MKKILSLFIFALCAVGAWAQNLENGHEYVDLGLTSGTLWATCNVGADAPEAAGDFYAWGETETRYSAGGNTDNPTWKEGYSAGYDWSTHKWCKGSDHSFTKYLPKSKASSYGYEGFYDDKEILEKADDVASQLWGGRWVIPTVYQQKELYDECYWVWTNSYNGTGAPGYIVYKVKSAGDKGKIVYDGQTPSSSYSLSDVHIFLPAAGNRIGTDLYVGNNVYTVYRSSSLDIYEEPINSSSIGLNSNRIMIYVYGRRDWGYQVRPVYMNHVAQIGENGYTSLQDAFAAAQNGDVVDLIANAVTIHSSIDKDVTLRLNGFKIISNSTNEMCISVCNGANVTIDGTTAENGMSEIHLEQNDAAISLDERSSVTIKNVKIFDAPYYAIQCDGESHVLIESGYFKGRFNALYMQSGTAVISGGTFDGSGNDAIYIEGGSVTIADGCEYKGTRFLSMSRTAGTYTESFTFDGEVVSLTPTAVESINTDNASKVIKTIENGKVVIIRNGERYDITGRKM